MNQRMVIVASIFACVVLIVMGILYLNNRGDTMVNGIEMVYHVYLDGEHIGTSKSKEVVDSLISEKIESEKKEGTYDYRLMGELNYVPESNLSNFTGLFHLDEDALKVGVVAWAMKVNGETIGYLKNKVEVEGLLNQQKLRFLTGSETSDLNNGSEIKQLSFKSKRKKKVTVDFIEKIEIEKEVIEPKSLSKKSEINEVLNTPENSVGYYYVKRGDVLGSISQQYNLSVDELLELNPEIRESDILYIGQEVKVSEERYKLNVLIDKYETKEEVVPFDIIEQEDQTLYLGEKKVIKKGIKGSKRVTYHIVKNNNKIEMVKQIDETVLEKPVNQIVKVGTKIASSSGTGQLSMPTVGGIITSGYGPRWGTFHAGIDIAGVQDKTIKASDNGTVHYAGWGNGYGHRIVINHNNGLKTTYNHLERIDVKVGQAVAKGQKIGLMGNSGDSTGVHLHFEVIKNGIKQNPIHYIKSTTHHLDSNES